MLGGTCPWEPPSTARGGRERGLWGPRTRGPVSLPHAVSLASRPLPRAPVPLGRGWGRAPAAGACGHSCPSGGLGSDRCAPTPRRPRGSLTGRRLPAPLICTGSRATSGSADAPPAHVHPGPGARQAHLEVPVHNAHAVEVVDGVQHLADQRAGVLLRVKPLLHDPVEQLSPRHAVFEGKGKKNQKWENHQEELSTW